MKEKNVTDEIREEVKVTSNWTDDDGEVRELASEDFKRMKPLSSLPAGLQHILREIQRGNAASRPREKQVRVPAGRSLVGKHGSAS